MLKELLVNANSICRIDITPLTEIKYKWFNESVVIKRGFLWRKEKYVIKEGWGFDEATQSNVWFDGYLGGLHKPERLSLEEMERRPFKLIMSKWYSKPRIEISFLNKEYAVYYFESNEELDEIVSQIKSINSSLVNITK